MSFNIYPKLLPTAPPDLTEQEKFNAGIINTEFEELVKMKNKFIEKIEKYKKNLERLVLINTGASALSVGSGVSAIATGATFVGIPVAAGLGAVALASSVTSGFTGASVKKYQRKINSVNALLDIVTSTIAVFENSVSQALNDGRI